METLQLNFDAVIASEKRSLVVAVPYQEGMVATSEFCPKEMMSGAVTLMAAVRGEPLDDFIDDCRRQLTAMERIGPTDTDLDRHIGGLMAVVMDHLSREKKITTDALLRYADCFAHLLNAAGFPPDEIRSIYPRVVNTIRDLYPTSIAKPMS